MMGRTVSHYRTEEEISRGMGMVYRATDTRLNPEIAVKVLPEEVTAALAGALENSGYPACDGVLRGESRSPIPGADG